MTAEENTPGDRTTPPAPPPPTPPRLYRSPTDRVIAGVAGGMGAYFNVDPVWFRIAFVALALSGGSGVLLYLIAWIAIPEAPAGAEPVAASDRRPVPASAVVGAILIAVGGISLVNTLAPWAGRFVWPMVVIGIGVALLFGGLSRER